MIETINAIVVYVAVGMLGLVILDVLFLVIRWIAEVFNE